MPSHDPSRRSEKSDNVADYDGRLIAEAIRIQEGAEGAPIDDPSADNFARTAGGDLETRIVVRAANLAVAKRLAAALDHLRLGIRLAAGIGVALAFVAGATTARTALTVPSGTPVNFHWAVLSLLGVETVALLIWIAVGVFGRNARSVVSLGGLIAAAGERLGRWLHRGPAEAAMAQAAGVVMLRGAIARWTIGALTHGLWTSFLLGALGMTLLMLSVEQVSFAWQTTILSESSYLPLTEALAALPRIAGFTVPTEAGIVASRWVGEGPLPTSYSSAWAGLLVGAVVVYGIIPRGALLVLCLVARGRAIRRFRLDLGLPGYARLRERLMPSTRREGIVDGDRDEVEAPSVRPVPVVDFEGPVALVGFEIERPHRGWPPPVAGVDWIDLGLIEGRSDRDRAMARLAAARPGLVVIAASMLTTPDRGVGADLLALRRAADAPAALLLSDAARVRRRLAPPDAEQRAEDWRRLAAAAEIPPDQVIVIDLAAPEEAALSRLSRLLGREG
jgi:hypothetical protein